MDIPDTPDSHDERCVLAIVTLSDAVNHGDFSDADEAKIMEVIGLLGEEVMAKVRQE